MLLGSDAIPFDGLEPGREPNGICLTYSLLQIHLLQKRHEELNRRTWPTSRRLLPDGDRVIIYRQQSFAFFTLLEHMEMTLSLEGKPRRRALSKARRLLKDAAAKTGTDNPVGPPAADAPAPPPT